MKDKTPESASFINRGTQAEIPVHFNPSSLQYTVNNKLQNVKGQQNQQFVSESSAKLTMELVFDTTGSGANVCAETVRIAQLMGTKNQIPPEVTFLWGAFEFTGIVDTYQETIDFFSSQGVPLRSTISLGMTRQQHIFSRESSNAPSRQQGPVEVPTRPNQPIPRDVGAQNGQENLRNNERPTVVVDPSVKLAPPSAFATAAAQAGGAGTAGAGFAAGGGFAAGSSLGGGASFGTAGGAFSAGASAKGSASLGFGASGSASASSSTLFSAGASFTAGASFPSTTGAAASGWTANAWSGSQASAGVSASAGAFGGLRTQPAPANIRVDVVSITEHVDTYTYETSTDGLFELGGRVRITDSSFGSTPTPRGRIRFEED